MQNMLGSHSLTEAMQQRITDYSLEITSVPPIISLPRLLTTKLMFQSCDFFPPLKSQEHQAVARQRAGERPDSSEEYNQNVEGYQSLEKLSELRQYAL